MASNTPNLSLYMKDPVADGNDFFDVKTMMNDNWEKIDGFAGSMDAVKERLNTISRQDVTLQPGVQIINAAKSAPFSLSGITGRMLVNLIGRLGGCEAVSSWSSNVAIALDSTNKTSGSSSFKLTLGSVPATASASFLTTPGRKYIAVADVKNGNTSKVAISINGVTGANGNDVAAASAFASSVVRFAATDFFHIVTVTGTGNSGSTFNMDSVRVYEVSEADYTAAASLTPAQAATKYPYVDSVMPVRNPYAIRWTDATKTTIASMLALQTDLYADPVTGANADTVYERDGQYFKSKNWNRLILDGGLPWELNALKSGTGFKAVQLFRYTPISDISSNRNALVTKYDGKVLDNKGSSAGGASDQHNGGYAPDYGILLTVGVADSGWADGYTPTVDEIKAYFMGWRMRDQVTTAPYTSGVKAWGSLKSGGTDYYTNTLPTTKAADFSTPYQLVYQLATPTVEPIVSEGQLTFNEGDNQVEVGTGVVLRERARALLKQGYGTENPTLYSWNINNGSPSYEQSLTDYRIDRFVGIYKNGRLDKWRLFPNTTTQAGAMAQKLEVEYDSSAVYTVSYLAFMPSPVAPFTGSYATNEKTLLADLVDSVQQNTARVSVLENKKADKDNPGVLSPTLLNGVIVEASFSPVEYVKSSDGLVTFQGSVKPPSAGTFVMFRLPEGYRPKQLVALMCAGNTGAADVSVKVLVSENGNVQMESTVSLAWLRLDGIKFLANR
ncbi:hypothetical protein [Paenibacillus sp. BJ-4]|uniref:hypothetical protein n=1 Tax=Paenibacillus sp. BJ-4 TaxID=2878097 RepID=UPI001CF07579|nr:hypothetical protein [Paenibacillus sp. BJ-4]